eukprot:SAG31_NODE_9088_length_1337_cov_1.084814_2_plen_211_part_00
MTTISNKDMDDCCGLCAARSRCAASQFVPGEGPNAKGTCILKASRNHPTNIDKGAAFFPPGVVPPAPVLTEQAGLIVGDWKVVVGKAVNQAIFTGPHYPNKTTASHEPEKQLNISKVAVPSFACSMPGKRACLFNIFADPTEHHDLALAMPGKVDSMISALQNVSRSYFNPRRGIGQQAACKAAMDNSVTYKDGKNTKVTGFFVPWLELS